MILLRVLPLVINLQGLRWHQIILVHVVRVTYHSTGYWRRQETTVDRTKLSILQPILGLRTGEDKTRRVVRVTDLRNVVGDSWFARDKLKDDKFPSIFAVSTWSESVHWMSGQDLSSTAWGNPFNASLNIKRNQSEIVVPSDDECVLLDHQLSVLCSALSALRESPIVKKVSTTMSYAKKTLKSVQNMVKRKLITTVESTDSLPTDEDKMLRTCQRYSDCEITFWKKILIC